ncbi:MAG: hypothetical protein QXF26_09425 [Candidatus Bathyarchaeia archaeon]
MEVEIRGLEELRKTLSRISETFKKDLIEESINVIWEKAREYAPVRTGFLSEHIVKEVEVGRGRVISQAPYSAYVEFGTRPHIIRPRRARALRFEIGGEVIFARYVRHPGARGQFYMRRALEDAMERLGEIVSRIFR